MNGWYYRLKVERWDADAQSVVSIYSGVFKTQKGAERRALRYLDRLNGWRDEHRASITPFLADNILTDNLRRTNDDD